MSKQCEICGSPYHRHWDCPTSKPAKMPGGGIPPRSGGNNNQGNNTSPEDAALLIGAVLYGGYWIVSRTNGFVRSFFDRADIKKGIAPRPGNKWRAAGVLGAAFCAVAYGPNFFAPGAGDSILNGASAPFKFMGRLVSEPYEYVRSSWMKWQHPSIAVVSGPYSMETKQIEFFTAMDSNPHAAQKKAQEKCTEGADDLWSKVGCSPLALTPPGIQMCVAYGTNEKGQAVRAMIMAQTVPSQQAVCAPLQLNGEHCQAVQFTCNFN